MPSIRSDQSEFPQTPTSSVPKSGHKSVYIATIGLCLISLLMIAYTYSRGNRLMSMHSQLGERAIQMQVNIATVHVRVEELLAGEGPANMENIQHHLDLAVSAVDSMASFVSQSNSSEIVSDNPALLIELSLLAEDLVEFQRMVDLRLTKRSEAIAGSVTEAIFERVFSRVMERSTRIESLTEELAEKEKVWLRAALVLLSLLLVLGTVFAVLAQSRFYRNQTAGLARLSDAYAKLQGEMALREKATQALRAGEELLSTALESTADGLLVIDAKGKGWIHI